MKYGKSWRAIYEDSKVISWIGAEGGKLYCSIEEGGSNTRYSEEGLSAIQ